MPEPNYITPPWLVTLAAMSMGGDIDLDPCSSEDADSFVAAKNYYSDDGLARPWAGRVYCNPPGGVASDGSTPVDWWVRSCQHHDATGCPVVFLAFNAELIRTAQRTDFPPLDFADAICVPRKRIDFVNPQTLRPDKGNRYWSAVLYLGDEPELFRSAFGSIGSVVTKGVR